MVTSIIDGVNEIIDESLELSSIGTAPHFKHKLSCSKLKSIPPSFNANEILSKIYNQIETNFLNDSNRFYSKGPSSKNWRFEKILNIDAGNKSKEKTLEKTIAKLTSTEWVNQVPTSSGIIGSSSDKLRNIDLVHKLGKKTYEFIELKVESDTPLFSAFEIIINGLIYLVSRRFYSNQCIDSKEILNAKMIHLQTLAPYEYCLNFSLGWFEQELCRGLNVFILEKFNNEIEMDFSFTCFQKSFVWPCGDNELLEALNNRVSVTWND